MPPAPKVHPDGVQAVHDLERVLSSKSVTAESLLPASADSSLRGHEKFLPNGTVEAYLQEDSQNYPRLTKILRHFLAPSSDTQIPPVSAKDVATYCCRVLCILIRIGKATHIGTFVRYPDLWDSRLPFDHDHPPRSFPDQTDKSFYRLFVKEQYPFCAQVFSAHSSWAIPDHVILPIVERRSISEGGHSRVNRVELSPQHDNLVITIAFPGLLSVVLADYALAI